MKEVRFSAKNGFATTPKTSALMKRIKGKNTKPEKKLRHALWRLGLRYRLHPKNLIGKPDIVFVSKRIAIFVDGDFWHGYDWKVRKNQLKINQEFWISKIERNIKRDRENTIKLINAGWCVLRFWEHEVLKNLDRCVKKIIFVMDSDSN